MGTFAFSFYPVFPESGQLQELPEIAGQGEHIARNTTVFCRFPGLPAAENRNKK
jgi:hypothetical protein